MTGGRVPQLTVQCLPRCYRPFWCPPESRFFHSRAGGEYAVLFYCSSPHDFSEKSTHFSELIILCAAPCSSMGACPGAHGGFSPLLVGRHSSAVADAVAFFGDIMCVHPPAATGCRGSSNVMSANQQSLTSTPWLGIAVLVVA